MMLEKFDIEINPEQSAYNELADYLWECEKFSAEKDDYQCFLDGLGRENFQFWAVYDKDPRRFIASILCSVMPSKDPQRPAFGSIALLFVHPDYRGLGIGSELFDKVMKSERFKDINIYITSVPHMTAKYRTRYGFDKQPTWRHNFYKIRILNIEKVATEITNLDIRYASVTSLNENEWQQLLEYDANIVGGIERAKYIRLILNVKTSTSMVAFDANDKVIGICSVRELTEPKTIMAGPWFAETLDIAESLLRRVLASACERASYENIVFAIPSNNSSGIELIKRIGKNEVEEIDVYCPQFNKEVIEVITHKIFSGADPDLLII